MKEVKVSEIQGAALDWAVGKVCAGNNWGSAHFREGWMRNWNPSTDWSQGGPLIEEFGIKLECMRDGRSWFAGWNCASEGWNSRYEMLDGEQKNGESSPLIAACRAIVSAKLGDFVSIPDELVEG